MNVCYLAEFGRSRSNGWCDQIRQGNI